MSKQNDTSAPEIPTIGQLAPRFPAYRFDALIAQGGMGAVYKARQLSLDRAVAIKILPRSLGDDENFRTSFEAEAKAMARLNHPNLVAVYDFGEVDGLLFIVMECVPGKSLHHSAFGTAIDPVQAGNLVSGICRGLDHAHRQGVLHRDIKPGNILLDEEANPKIGDFGLASPIGNEAAEDDTIFGTPGYTAPEVYRREPASPLGDIYSIGVLLHELLTGALPDGSGTPPSMIGGCPREFDAIVARATKPAAALRFSSAGELADALDRVVEQVRARPVVNRAALKAAPPSIVTKKLPRSLATKRSSLPLVIFTGACVLVGIVTAVVLQPDETPEPVVTDAQDAPADRIDITDVTLEEAYPVGDQDPFAGGGEPAPADSLASKPSPLESLTALKEKLAGGRRDEFPLGTESHKGDHFLLVDQALTWRQARKFAEEHGGHLAVLQTEGDRRWFNAQFRLKQPVWLGGGKAAKQRWQWLDGTSWLLGDRPLETSESQDSLSLTRSATLSAASSEKPYHFAIQWRDGLENSATIGAELRRTAVSVKADGVTLARCPVGTRTDQAGGSHYLVVHRALPWDDARKIAEAAGGYLAVPSTEAESLWLRDQLDREVGSFWIGGFRLQPLDPWRWLTREAWTHSGWLSEPSVAEPEFDRAALRFGGSVAASGWLASDPGGREVSGFVIEWSTPKKAASIESFDLTTWLADIDGKFKKRLAPEVKRFEAARGKEIASYSRAMKREARSRKSDRGGYPGRGGWGDWGAWRGERAEKTVEEAMEKVEAAASLSVLQIPEFAPSEFKVIHGNAEKIFDKLEREHEQHVSDDAALYSRGLLKHSGLLRESGFEVDAAALETLAMTSAESAEEFLIALDLRAK